MNIYRQSLLGLIAQLAVFSVPAYADDGFIAGVSIGSAELSDDFDGLTVDTDATAYRITAGWRFSEYFAVEAGYHNFGDFEQQILIGGNPVTATLTADGYLLGITGAWPVAADFALTGRLGWFFWDGAAEINNVSQATPEDSNLYLGAGVRYSLNDRFALTADWTRYDLEDTTSNVLSAGFLVSFGR